MDLLQEHLIDPISRILWNYVLIYLLIGAGLFFTIRTRFVQVRMVKPMIETLRESTKGSDRGVSSFQALAIGLASRVGTGNIAGVAIALTIGGPGAIFWMWVVGAVGMATAFIEATLAQMYKVRSPDGTFRGGPAFYIERGLNSRTWGAIFAVLLIIAFGIAFNMVQANTVADVMSSAFTLSPRWTALTLMLLTAPVVFGGVKRIAVVAGNILPAMAGVYVLMAVAVMLINFEYIDDMFVAIFEYAFGIRSFAGGVAGGIAVAALNGAKRGLFSNEAGMGSAPNAAATAVTSHPVKQGLIQSFGVFVDTMLICTATAFIILSAGPDVYVPGETPDSEGAALTMEALSHTLGDWSGGLMALMVFVFAYTSVLGNYTYTEINLDYLHAKPRVVTAFRVVVLLSVMIGSFIALENVWAIADVSQGLMALVNLTAILLLSKWAMGALKDFEKLRSAGQDPLFVSTENENLPGTLPGDIWAHRVEQPHEAR